jgi:hypothetical protein
MTTHPFWGIVQEDWAGLSAEQSTMLPPFEQPIPVFLGEELLEEGEEYDVSAGLLDDYAATFQAFQAEAPRLIAALRDQAFARYLEVYAHYYENPAKSGEPALGLTTAEQHFAYMQDVTLLRVSSEQVIRFVIEYDLDPEHGLEAKFVGNVLTDLGCIAET